ncbi:beta-microseminoprotein-like [Chelonia mydas]|uniref:beta-microseminoprotein-like n=1 Tax=Chelonia mydas TaxID=8469 RepID=UPI001CA96E39|nr:beta-microseminoprotein-like [Chelonia mydas]
MLPGKGSAHHRVKSIKHGLPYKKCFLSFLLAFVLSTTLCDAQCYAEMIDPKAKGCNDRDGAFHKFNTRWKTKDCFRCTCRKQTIECCSLFAIPTSYNEQKCKRIFHAKTCRYTVVEKANPSKTCKVQGWVA